MPFRAEHRDVVGAGRQGQQLLDGARIPAMPLPMTTSLRVPGAWLRSGARFTETRPSVTRAG